ncbi:hypothetical protein AAZV13_03G106600 [Glycine max]
MESVINLWSLSYLRKFCHLHTIIFLTICISFNPKYKLSNKMYQKVKKKKKRLQKSKRIIDYNFFINAYQFPRATSSTLSTFGIICPQLGMKSKSKHLCCLQVCIKAKRDYWAELVPATSQR